MYEIAVILPRTGHQATSHIAVSGQLTCLHARKFNGFCYPRVSKMHRFFIRDFFAIYKEKSSKSCGHLSIGSGEVVFAKVEGGSHDSPSVQGYSPAPGPRKLRD